MSCRACKAPDVMRIDDGGAMMPIFYRWRDTALRRRSNPSGSG